MGSTFMGFKTQERFTIRMDNSKERENSVRVGITVVGIKTCGYSVIDGKV